MNIESTTDPVVYRMITRDRMREQLATIVGMIAGMALFFLIPASLPLCKRLALLLGIWKEPTLVDALAMCLILPFVALLIGLAVRWMLIYRWVMLAGRR